MIKCPEGTLSPSEFFLEGQLGGVKARARGQLPPAPPSGAAHAKEIIYWQSTNNISFHF